MGEQVVRRQVGPSWRRLALRPPAFTLACGPLLGHCWASIVGPALLDHRCWTGSVRPACQALALIVLWRGLAACPLACLPVGRSPPSICQILPNESVSWTGRIARTAKK